MHRPFLSRFIIWATSLLFAALIAPGSAAGPVGCGSQRAGCAINPFRSNPSPKITPRLWAELAASDEADVLVFVRGRPDLTPARALSSKKAKGRFVVDALQATAEKTQAGLRRLLDARGVDYQAFWIVNMLRVRGDSTLISELARRPEVEKLDLNIVVPGLGPPSPPGPQREVDSSQPSYLTASTSPPWGVTSIGAPSVWEQGIRGQGIVVAGNDTGVDWDHAALINAYRGWDGQSADHNYNWHDAWNKTPLVPSDDHGHGTHTIGTAVGGGPKQIGVAPDARWIACRNMNNGFGTPASYVDCFQFFLAPTDLNGQNPRPELAPHVINNSWGCPESEGCHPDDPLWEDTIQPAIEALTAAGIAVVVSAGNYGSRGCESVLDPPAIYPQSLDVGAIRASFSIAGFSSRGPVSVGGRDMPAPDLAAPGVGVLSSIPNNGYVEWQGTSMAAPHVAGTIALLWSAAPQLVGRLAVTEQILRATATPKPDLTCGGDLDGQPNNVYGWGVINAAAAVAAVKDLGTIVGTVTDADGRPLSGVSLSVVEEKWDTQIHLMTDAQGWYLTPVLSGTYRVVADTEAHFAETRVVQVPAGNYANGGLRLLPCVDWDKDGKTGLVEAQQVAGDWRVPNFVPQHDVNRDGEVNVLDVMQIAKHLNEACSPQPPARR